MQDSEIIEGLCELPLDVVLDDLPVAFAQLFR